jgi:hypothetical protein
VVPTVFKCCMCNHDDAVECDLGLLCTLLLLSSAQGSLFPSFISDLKNKVGNLTCRICGANFQAEITCITRVPSSTTHNPATIDLTEPIDLFCEYDPNLPHPSSFSGHIDGSTKQRQPRLPMDSNDGSDHHFVFW